MPIEMSYLVASVGLFIVMVSIQAAIGASGHSLGTLLGPRDGFTDKSAMAGRARRANANMIEALLMFAPLVLVAAQTGRLNEMTALGAALFFWSRVAFAPLYWFGVPVVRTIAWFVGVAGILIIFWQVLPFSGAA